MKTLDATPHLYTKEQATQIVNELNADEYDDWTYEISEDPKGGKWCQIHIYENGEFVAKM